MSTEFDWGLARKGYAERTPDPLNPKLPQSGNWLDVELAFFLDIDVETFRRNVRDRRVPHEKYGHKMVLQMTELVKGRIYATEAEQQDEKGEEARERGGLDLETPKRKVRGRRDSARNEGAKATEGDGSIPERGAGSKGKASKRGKPRSEKDK